MFFVAIAIALAIYAAIMLPALIWEINSADQWEADRAAKRQAMADNAHMLTK